MAIKLNDNERLFVTGFNGLLLGHGLYASTHEFASEAIDVDLSYGDIRPFNCMENVCTVSGDCLTYVSDDCCKGEGFSHVCHKGGYLVIEDGIIYDRSDPCSGGCRLGPPQPITPPSGCGVECGCGGANMVVRYAYYDDQGRIGPLSAPSTVRGTCYTTVPAAPGGYCIGGVVVFAAHGGLSTASSDTGHLGYIGHINTDGGAVSASQGVGFPAYSEGWFEPPVGADFLVRHKSGAYMAASGNVLHISHKSFANLWDKYRLCFCNDIIYVIEVKGRVIVFDGEYMYLVTESRMGFDADIVDEVCITDKRQIASDGNVIVIADKDGLKQVGVSNLDSSNAVSSGVLIDDEVINPQETRNMNQNWRVAVYNGRIHFANDEGAWIYNTTKKGRQRALTASSVIPDDYYVDCDNLYYLVDGQVKRWNPPNGTPCPYKYCTNPIVFDECVNMGGYRTMGIEHGDERTVATFYNHWCSNKTEICNCTDLLCDTKHITVCENMREMMICWEGTDIISGYELGRTPRTMK